MIMHIVMVKFTIGIVPQFVVTTDNRLVVVKHLHWLGINALKQAIESVTNEFLERILRFIGEVDPYEATVPDLTT